MNNFYMQYCIYFCENTNNILSEKNIIQEHTGYRSYKNV